MAGKIIQVEERVPLLKGIPLSIQHTFAMFSASVLVPWLFGINAAIVLLMNGIGTLIFIVITKGKSPAYLGSSFAFISPTLLLISNPDFGYPYAEVDGKKVDNYTPDRFIYTYSFVKKS